ncbi:Uncharacterised protein [Mycobacteroides abscessus subsp. abscessus]|nr:Uncharacterised protein [Mycobacteroides abscessus subsp. abscessus]
MHGYFRKQFFYHFKGRLLQFGFFSSLDQNAFAAIPL